MVLLALRLEAVRGVGLGCPSEAQIGASLLIVDNVFDLHIVLCCLLTLGHVGVIQTLHNADLHYLGYPQLLVCDRFFKLWTASANPQFATEAIALIAVLDSNGSGFTMWGTHKSLTRFDLILLPAMAVWLLAVDDSYAKLPPVIFRSSKGETCWL